MDELRAVVAEAEASGRDAYSGTAVVAGELANGRGRMGRSWYAPPGGLHLAVLLAPELAPERMGLYPLAAGVAAAEVARLYLPQARLKWINDVHVGGRKLCGLLAESYHSARHRQEYLLLGLGLNANVATFPNELDGLATSLSLELGRRLDIDLLCAQALHRLGLWLGLLHRHEQLVLEAEHSPEPPANPVVAAFRELTDTFGRRVLYRAGDGDPGAQATAVDIAEDGGLILELEGGARHTAHGGEILYLVGSADGQ